MNLRSANRHLLSCEPALSKPSSEGERTAHSTPPSLALATHCPSPSRKDMGKAACDCQEVRDFRPACRVAHRVLGPCGRAEAEGHGAKGPGCQRDRAPVSSHLLPGGEGLKKPSWRFSTTLTDRTSEETTKLQARPSCSRSWACVPTLTHLLRWQKLHSPSCPRIVTRPSGVEVHAVSSGT